MQDEGAVTKCESLIDFQETKPKRMGSKFRPKLFTNFRLDHFVPDTNFYKVLKNKLDLSFIYKSTKKVYSHTGRPGLDPVVFFKMLLVGYLENCPTDRGLERLFQMRMNLRYFIDL